MLASPIHVRRLPSKSHGEIIPSERLGTLYVRLSFNLHKNITRGNSKTFMFNIAKMWWATRNFPRRKQERKIYIHLVIERWTLSSHFHLFTGGYGATELVCWEIIFQGSTRTYQFSVSFRFILFLAQNLLHRCLEYDNNSNKFFI